MLISRSRSRFWTIVTSRDPVHVATQCVIQASIFTWSLDFSSRSNRILVSFSPVLKFLSLWTGSAVTNRI